jgi:hypothetical protein
MSDDEPPGCARSFFSGLLVGAYLGLLWNLVRRPGATFGCGCVFAFLLIVLPIMLIVGFIVSYPAVSAFITVAILAIVGWRLLRV